MYGNLLLNVSGYKFPNIATSCIIPEPEMPASLHCIGLPIETSMVDALYKHNVSIRLSVLFIYIFN